MRVFTPGEIAAHSTNKYLGVLDYWYGIDAPNFGVNFPTKVNGQSFSNLGSSASATLNIPIWNWGLTQSRVKQAELRRTQAQRDLSLAQRKLLAEIQSLYAEADTALNELAGLARSAELAAESLRLTILRYKGGEATVLEVVDAQTGQVTDLSLSDTVPNLSALGPVTVDSDSSA